MHTWNHLEPARPVLKCLNILSDQNEGHLVSKYWEVWFQENYNTHPRQSPCPTMKGIPLWPVGKGYPGCVPKGVLKGPLFATLGVQTNRSYCPVTPLVDEKNTWYYCTYIYIYIHGVYTMKLGARVFSSTAVVSYISATVTSIKIHFRGPILLSALVRGRCPHFGDNIQHGLTPPSQIPTPSLQVWFVSPFILIIYAS